MKSVYIIQAVLFKALSDPNRLMIVDMLSCGELCACNLLSQLQITQPTLSHHMKILSECGLVSVRKEGRWMYYSLCDQGINEMRDFIEILTSDNKDCVCLSTQFLGNCNESYT